jgi:hypothetical protein
VRETRCVRKGKKVEGIHYGSENERCGKKSTLKISTKHENQIKITNPGDFGRAGAGKEKASAGEEAGVQAARLK